MPNLKRAKSTIHDISVKSAPPRVHPVDADLAAPAPAIPPVEPPAPKPAEAVEAGKGTTVHLTKHAARELKKLAADRDTTVHALMIEGVNLVFERYNLPPIAAPGPRPEAARKKAAKVAS